MTHALNARLRRLEQRIRPQANAADYQARQERTLERLDGMLAAFPAPTWCDEQRWSRMERLAARVAIDPELIAVCERRSAEPIAGPFFRRVLEVGHRLADHHANGVATP